MSYLKKISDFIIEKVKYGKEPETSDDVSISVSLDEMEQYTADKNRTADTQLQVTGYNYVTYGKIPPKFIYVKPTDGGTYKGVLELQSYSYFKASDKFSGIYSGILYLK